MLCICNIGLFGFVKYSRLCNFSTNKMPARFNEDMIRPALIAYFRMGRLYSKIVTPDKAVQLEHLKQSLNAYTVCSSTILQESGLAETKESRTLVLLSYY
jgi:hypothetical protein